MDCLDGMKMIPDKSIDMILCDLPYGTTQCKWDLIIPFEPLWEQYERVIKDNGAIVLFGCEPFASYLRLSNIRSYKYDWVWDKVKGTGFLNAKRQPMRNHETVCVFYKKQCTYNPQKTHGHNRKQSYRSKDLQTMYTARLKNDTHMTYRKISKGVFRCFQLYSKQLFASNSKPVFIVEYLIKPTTNEGETVLDNCMGPAQPHACIKPTATT